MKTKAFGSAIFKTNQLNEIVFPESINKDLYSSKYKGYLFCPNEKCNARLKLVIRKNGTLHIFQSIDIHEHIRSCPYYFEYKKYDSDEKVTKMFSDGHIIDALRRQMAKFGVVNSRKYAPKFKDERKKQINRLNEPPINFFNCEAVDENLIGDVISVGGFVDSVKIVYEDDPDKIHAYINFVRSDANKVSVLVSHNQYSREIETHKALNQIRHDWKNTPSKKRFTCICFGWIQEVDKGINVVPSKLVAIRTGYK